jgi:hypothetical protein
MILGSCSDMLNKKRKRKRKKKTRKKEEERYDFGEIWCKWVAYCISSMPFSILVNETLSCFFSGSHGLRQGDTLSHLLFVIVMEALSKMISTLVDGVF